MNYMKTALQVAHENTIHNEYHGKAPISRFGAVLTNGKRIYVGQNKWKTHPLMLKFNKHPAALFLHAEIDVIVKAIRDGVDDFSDYEMYVARLTKGGRTGIACPCEGCQGALKAFGIDFKNVYWTK